MLSRYDRWHVDTVVLALRVALAAVFATAVVGKLLDFSALRPALFGFGIKGRAASIGGPLLLATEAAIATALLIQPSARWGAVAGVVVLVGFIGGIVNVLARGRTSSCHCFGVFHSAPASWKTVFRNAGLAAIGGVIVWAGPGPSLTGWVSDRSAAELAASAIGIGAIVLAILALRLRRDRNKLRRSLSETEARLADVPPGLPVGAVAPDFAVPEVRGGTVSLDELLGRGLPVLLTFVGRGCLPSEELAPDLARWQGTLSDRLTIALVSWGGPEHNQYESERLGIDDIGLQSLDGELLAAYRIRGTPSGVLISTDGRVMANIAESGPGIESLIRLALRRTARGSSDGALGQPAAASRSPAGA